MNPCTLVISTLVTVFACRDDLFKPVLDSSREEFIKQWLDAEDKVRELLNKLKTGASLN